MKQLLLLLTSILFFTLSLDAQQETELNSVVIGGSFNFIFQRNFAPLSGITSGIGGIGTVFGVSTEDIKNNSAAFTPYVGATLDQHWLIGALIDLRLAKFTGQQFILNSPSPIPQDFERKSNQIGLGFFARYTFNPERTFNLFVQPYLIYNFLNETETIATFSVVEEDIEFLEIGLTAGMLYKVTPRFRLTLRGGALRFVTGRWQSDGPSADRTFTTFDGNFNLANFFLGGEFLF